MSLDFNSLKTEIIRPSGDRDKTWVRVTIVLLNTETDHRHTIVVPALVKSSPTSTISELQTEARDQVKTALSTALRLFEAHSLDELEEMEAVSSQEL